jgi:membrane-bound lytic murein transglycosylase A
MATKTERDRKPFRRLILCAFLALFTLSACGEEAEETAEEEGQASPEQETETPTGQGFVIEGPGGEVSLSPVGFEALPGWKDDEMGAALSAFARSCEKFRSLPPERPQKPEALGLTVADWLSVCEWLPPPGDPASARAFFETHFQPFAVESGGEPWGIITGYYEATLNGSLEKGPGYPVPLYNVPDDLISLDLSDFGEDLPDRTLVGRVEAQRFLPYHPRAAINEGALEGRGLEVLWLADPVDAFFLSVQGSGVVTLPDGGEQRVGYAGNNGHEFYAIGRALLESGEVPRDQMSMQAIRDWLRANPERARELMERNARYIFFRLLEGEGPIGAQGVALTPERSLAVDRAYLPLGAPLYLQTESAQEDLVFQRLMIAQDTGAAITGGVRGDFFFGKGEPALARAGRMKEKGRYWLLLPEAAAARLTAGPAGS